MLSPLTLILDGGPRLYFDLAAPAEAVGRDIVGLFHLTEEARACPDPARAHALYTDALRDFVAMVATDWPAPDVALAAAWTPHALRNMGGVLYNRAGARISLGDAAAALSDLDAALAIDAVTRTPPSERADLRERRAAARQRLGDASGALADWADALRVCPGHALTLNNRALVHAETGAFDDALADVMAALATDPLDALVHVTHAEILAASGQPDAALDALRTAVGLDPEAAVYLAATPFDTLRADPRFLVL